MEAKLYSKLLKTPTFLTDSYFGQIDNQLDINPKIFHKQKWSR